MIESPRYINLESDYGNTGIDIAVFHADRSRSLVVNIHGAYGTMKSGSGKYWRMAKALHSSGAAHVVLYQSARNRSSDAPPESLSYQARKQAFVGKRFEHELEELRRVLRYCQTHSSELFGEPFDQLKMVLNGNSLGGVLAIAVACELPQLRAVQMVGTGLYLPQQESESRTLYPTPETIRSYAEHFSGDLVAHYGTADTVFSAQSCVDLVHCFRNARTRLIAHQGVDHAFDRRNGVEDRDAFQAVTDSLRSLCA